MPSDASNSRVRVVEQRGKQWVEAVRVGVDVCVALIELQTCAEEFGGEGCDDYSAGAVGLEDLGFDVAECGDEGLGVLGVDPVLGCLFHGDDLDLWRARGGGDVQVLEGGLRGACHG